MFSLLRKKPAKYTRSTTRTANRAAAHVTARPVSHERWIPVSELQMGMYVSELNVPWEGTGFMFQGFQINSIELLKQVKKTCDEVLVRSEKVAYVSSASSDRMCRAVR